MTKNLETNLHLWAFCFFQFTHTPTTPPAPQTTLDANIQNLFRVSTMHVQGGGRENREQLSKRMHCFMRVPRNYRKSWILHWRPGLYNGGAQSSNQNKRRRVTSFRYNNFQDHWTILLDFKWLDLGVSSRNWNVWENWEVLQSKQHSPFTWIATQKEFTEIKNYNQCTSQ